MYEDLTELNYSELPDVDLFVAGFPCQSFSIAGKRLGTKDKKGKIFFNIYDYLKAKKPDIFILENVKGLLSDQGGKTFNLILELLSQSINGQQMLFTHPDSLNYHVYYKVLNAKDYSIPQNRERVFIIGFKNFRAFNFPEKQELKLRLKDLLEDDVKEKYYLSDKQFNSLMGGIQKSKVNPSIAASLQTPGNAAGNYRGMNMIKEERKTDSFSRTNGIEKEINISYSLDASNYRGINRNQIQNAVIEPKALTTARTEKGKKIRSKNMKKGKDYNSFSETKLVPRNDNLMGSLYANPNPVKDYLLQEPVPVLTPDRLKKRQNGRRFKNPGETRFTLNTQDKHGILYKNKIRRLTALECARLMGFADSFIFPVSDTQKYRQCGNSIVVNVLMEIFKEMYNK